MRDPFFFIASAIALVVTLHYLWAELEAAITALT